MRDQVKSSGVLYLARLHLLSCMQSTKQGSQKEEMGLDPREWKFRRGVRGVCGGVRGNCAVIGAYDAPVWKVMLVILLRSDEKG